MADAIHYEPIAEDALLLRFGDAIDPATSARVLAAAGLLRDLHPPVECVPAYASLLLRFDPAAWADVDGSSPHARLRAATAIALANSGTDTEDSRDIVIPVCYGADHGPDLAAVAAHLGISEHEVIARHAAGAYRVAMIGFAPGFPYLLGLDPGLAMPRRAEPRQRVPPGSVAIGGSQTGIYPEALPGGWQLIGCTPQPLFDIHNEPPALLAPGDRVRFEPIDSARFAELERSAQR